MRFKEKSIDGTKRVRLENPIGSGIVPPVTGRVATAHMDPFFIPLHPGTDTGCTVPEGQPTSSPWRVIRFGTMQ